MAAIYEEAHVGVFQVASVWAIVVTFAIAVTGPVSRAHLKPAMLLAFAFLRPSKPSDFQSLYPILFPNLLVPLQYS